MASVLEQFDFEATTDDPQLLPREGSGVPIYDEAIVSTIEELCAHGQLSVVQRKVESLRRSSGELAMSYLGRALRVAASNRHTSAVAACRVPPRPRCSCEFLLYPERYAGGEHGRARLVLQWPLGH